VSETSFAEQQKEIFSVFKGGDNRWIKGAKKHFQR